MHTFFVKLADVEIAIVCNYDETKKFLEEYLIKECYNPMVRVIVTPDDILLERKKVEDVYGEKNCLFSDTYIETLVVCDRIAEQMPTYNTIFFHGSVVAVDGEAYLFTAPSGTGKSTHTRLWRRIFGERAFMVNDDKPLLKVTDAGQVIAYGNPWDGKHRLSRNVGIPLKGICILAQEKENCIRRTTREEAVITMMQQTYRPTKQTEAMKQTLRVLERIMDVGVWHMGCNISLDAAKLSYETMSGKELL